MGSDEGTCVAETVGRGGKSKEEKETKEELEKVQVRRNGRIRKAGWRAGVRTVSLAHMGCFAGRVVFLLTYIQTGMIRLAIHGSQKHETEG